MNDNERCTSISPDGVRCWLEVGHDGAHRVMDSAWPNIGNEVRPNNPRVRNEWLAWMVGRNR